MTKHKKHNMKATSLLAYAEVLENLGEREAQVYQAVRELGVANNTMIAKHLDLPINCVVGRVFSLRKYGVLVYSKRDTCPLTLKKTMFWKVGRKL